jgi:hypothetical protein
MGSVSYISLLLEGNQNCNLTRVDETEPIKNLGFGQKAKADTCEKISVKCRYTEDVQNSSDDNVWYKAKKGDTLFQFY